MADPCCRLAFDGMARSIYGAVLVFGETGPLGLPR